MNGGIWILANKEEECHSGIFLDLVSPGFPEDKEFGQGIQCEIKTYRTVDRSRDLFVSLDSFGNRKVKNPRNVMELQGGLQRVH